MVNRILAPDARSMAEAVGTRSAVHLGCGRRPAKPGGTMRYVRASQDSQQHRATGVTALATLRVNKPDPPLMFEVSMHHVTAQTETVSCDARPELHA